MSTPNHRISYRYGELQDSSIESPTGQDGAAATSIGTLYSIDFQGVADPAMLNDPERLAAMMGRVIAMSGLQIVGTPMVHHFSPHGLTYLMLLAQSHLAVHTWPEYQFMTVDFFTCGDPALGYQACVVLQKAISCAHVAVRSIERYLSSPGENS